MSPGSSCRDGAAAMPSEFAETRRSAAARCTAWLDDLCRQLGNVRVALVTLEGCNAGGAPLAHWPDRLEDTSALMPLAEGALQERRLLVRAAEPHDDGEVVIAYPLLVDGAAAGVVALVLMRRADAAARALETLHWAAGRLEAIVWRERHAAEAARVRRAALALDLVALVNECADVQAALLAVVDPWAAALPARRVLAGVATDQGVALAAMSGAAGFDRDARQVRRFEAAMEEALMQGGSVRFPATGPATCSAHAELAAKLGDACLLSIVLPGSAAVLTFERDRATAFDDDSRALCEALAALLAPLLAAKRPRPALDRIWRFGLERLWPRLRGGVAADSVPQPARRLPPALQRQPR